jgi:hypothetical protein
MTVMAPMMAAAVFVPRAFPSGALPAAHKIYSWMHPQRQIEAAVVAKPVEASRAIDKKTSQNKADLHPHYEIHDFVEVFSAKIDGANAGDDAETQPIKVEQLLAGCCEERQAAGTIAHPLHILQHNSRSSLRAPN